MENQIDQQTTEAQQHPSPSETSATNKVIETTNDNLASNFANGNSNEATSSLDDNKDDSTLNGELIKVEEKQNLEQQQQQQSTASPSAEHSTTGMPDYAPSELSELPDEDTGSEKSRDSSNENLSQQDRSNQSSKSGQDNNSHREEGASLLDGDPAASALGRNRRVRQKNRYFLDFHCIDLTKGGRSKEDFSYTQAANIRATSRRSTADSSRGPQDDPDVSVETKYCRKCSTRTAHDSDGGCQVCLYKKIVSSSRRQRQTTQKNRSTSRQQQKQNQHDKEPGSLATSSSNKRKATRQAGGPAKLNNITPNIQALNDTNSISINNVKGNSETGKVPDIIVSNSNDQGNISSRGSLNDFVDKTELSSPILAATTTPTTNLTSNNSNSTKISQPSTKVAANISHDKSRPKIKSEIDSNDLSTNGTSDLPLIDSWTPDEVAEFIQSRGFKNEAESFRTESVDGISLLLMQRTDFTYGLRLKLGPALKIYDQVCKLKRDYFRKMTAATS